MNEKYFFITFLHKNLLLVHTIFEQVNHQLYLQHETF